MASEPSYPLTIGAAAEASGVSAKMIRYYESIGLIAPALRTASGYRLYQESDVHTLRFVRRARDLGFLVDEIGDLVALWRDRGRASGEVKRIALDHVRQLEEKARHLRAMADTLRRLSETCHGDDRPSCPILDELAGESEPAADASPPDHRFGPTHLASRKAAGSTA